MARGSPAYGWFMYVYTKIEKYSLWQLATPRRTISRRVPPVDSIFHIGYFRSCHSTLIKVTSFFQEEFLSHSEKHGGFPPIKQIDELAKNESYARKGSPRFLLVSRFLFLSIFYFFPSSRDETERAGTFRVNFTMQRRVPFHDFQRHAGFPR